MGARKSRTEWESIVGAFRKSDGDVERFCARRGINIATLRWWRSRLRDEVAVEAKTAGDVRLVPVEVVSAVPSAPVTVSLVVGDVQMVVEVGTDVGYVAALAAELRGRC